MPGATLSQRVEVLEAAVVQLATLPARVDAIETTITEFRDEVRQEFAAVRSEIGDTRRQMLVLHEDVIERIKTIGESIDNLRSR